MRATIGSVTDPDAAPMAFEGNLSGLGLDLKIGKDGDIQLSRQPQPPADRGPAPDDAAARPRTTSI